MEMQLSRREPATVAALIGATALGAYVSLVGLGADIGHSLAALVRVCLVFASPGCAGTLYMEWRARHDARVKATAKAWAEAHRRMRASAAARPPFFAAEAVVELRPTDAGRCYQPVKGRLSK